MLRYTLVETSSGGPPSVKSYAGFFFAESLNATVDLAFFATWPPCPLRRSPSVDVWTPRLLAGPKVAASKHRENYANLAEVRQNLRT